jgi:hypothetical protein
MEYLKNSINPLFFNPIRQYKCTNVVAEFESQSEDQFI